MFSVKYFTEKAETLYEKAMEAYSANEYASAASHLRDGAYYLRQAAQAEGAEGQANFARAEKFERLAEMLSQKALSVKKATETSSPTFQRAVGSGMEQQGNDEEEQNEFFTFIPAEKISVSFNDVIGLEDAKHAVTEYVINPILYPEAYNYNFLNNKGILLEGPPGTGKSTFAKAVSREVKQPFALINVAQLVNCYVGETGKNIDKVFAYLREYTEKHDCGATIFFDEFDEIAKRRGGDDKAAEAAVPALLRNLDGFLSDNRFLIIANTNCMRALDPAILDRFRRKIYIPLPDLDSRYRLFLSKTADMEREYREDIDWQRAAELSEGLSGRTITFLCDDLKYYLSGVKAGLKPLVDLNEKLAELIENRKGNI